MRTAQAIVSMTIDKLRQRGATDDEIRRLVEAHLAGLHTPGDSRD
jgi:hypothetical protein